MGSIEPYDSASGRRYRVRYRDPDRQSRERGGFRTKHAAEEYLAGVTVSAARGDYVDPRDAQAKIDELGAVWLASQQHLKPSTHRSQETAWRVHVAPFWGHRRVGEIRHSEVSSWAASFSLGSDPSHPQ